VPVWYRLCVLATAAGIGLFQGEAAAVSGFEWRTATPEHHGFSSAKLNALREVLAGLGTKTFLLIRNDAIIYEWYAPGFDQKKQHYTASLVKALVGGLSLMLALEDELIEIDDPAWKFIPSWKDHPDKSRITIRHLATHSSGIEDAEAPGLRHEALPGWKGAFWKREPDPFTIARDQAPVVFAPGTAYAYSNPGMAMLAYVVTAALQNGAQQDIRTLLRERIMRPIGVPDSEWSIGYGHTYEVAGLPLVANWGGGSYTARAVARVGRLMLNQGTWEGRRLVSRRSVEQAVAYAGTPLPSRAQGHPEPSAGLGWWTNHDGIWNQVPRDAFGGAGAGNQVLLVVPSLDMILVRNGGQLGNTFWGGVTEHLFTPLMEAMTGPPYPSSQVVLDVEWAPVSAIRRAGAGSDNWPLTWGDDDALYTAYGDGWGFEPKVSHKLSLGLAVIRGGAEAFQGENIRSDTGEQTGDGRRGIKASGLLMVDGVLYMLARNADHQGGQCRLAWSEDRGRTWEWASWVFEEFGHLTFVNFGKNYEGARDAYVYVTLPDSRSAYQPADSMILLRVPKDRINEREAYQAFMGLKAGGTPRWTGDLARRAPVFVHPGRCLRSGMSYNAGLKRYLWWQQIPRGPGADTRFQGGFGIYEAPEPWGPWRTVFFTERWDTGPGESGSFPTKWMSDDGKTLYLVFSGNDAFSVRRAVLRTMRQ